MRQVARTYIDIGTALRTLRRLQRGKSVLKVHDMPPGLCELGKPTKEEL